MARDSSADQLRRRMLHGNIYPPEKVPEAPGSDVVVRRAARMAQRTKGELLVLHVRDTEREGQRSPRIETLRVLAGAVGGTWLEVRGDDPARTVVDVAAGRQVTQIVLGASQRSRWTELTRGSVVRKVLRFAAERGIDVHVIARRQLRPDAARRGALGAGEGEESS